MKPTNVALPSPPNTSKGIELVSLRMLDPSLRIDLRYQSVNNFAGVALYPPEMLAKLRAPVAQALVAVRRRLCAQGLDLLVLDVFRPFSVQERIWAIYPDDRFVLRPVRVNGLPSTGSNHTKGTAVDATLTDAAGNELEMPTPFDEFSERASTGYAGGSATSRFNRGLLHAAFAAEGFVPHPNEWWHFDWVAGAAFGLIGDEEAAA